MAISQDELDLDAQEAESDLTDSFKVVSPIDSPLINRVFACIIGDDVSKGGIVEGGDYFADDFVISIRKALLPDGEIDQRSLLEVPTGSGNVYVIAAVRSSRSDPILILALEGQP